MNYSRLAQATVKGAIWNYITFALSKGVIFISTVVLARVLLPHDFGVMSMALILINYLQKLQGLGIDEAMIYHQEELDQVTNVAFVLSVVTGLFVTGVTFLLARPAAIFFQEPRVVPIVRALSFWFAISCPGIVHEAFLRKTLNFRRRLIPQLGLRVTKGGTSIALALLGFGVWSLVWGQLAGAMAATCLYWCLSPWRPRLYFNFGIARSLLKYGSQISLFDILHDVFGNVDYLIVGRRMAAEQLGFYTLAFRLPEIAIAGLHDVITPVIFPAYVTLQKDPAALRRGAVTTLQYMLLLCVPIGLGISLVSPEFVELFYTTRWMPVVPVMQALSIYTVLNSFGVVAEYVYKAMGRLEVANQMSLIRVFLAVPILWFAAGHNIFVVALGQVCIAFLSMILQFIMVNRVIAFPLADLWHAFKPAMTGAIVMLPGTLGLSVILARFSPFTRLVSLSAWGALLYAAALWFTQRQLLWQAFEILRKREEE